MQKDISKHKTLKSKKSPEALVKSSNLLYWRNVKDEFPTRGFSFLVYYQNQPPLMMIAWVDIHGNYRIQGNGDTAGFGKYPKFSHWMPLPEKPV